MSWLRSARAISGELVDVELAGGLIAQVVPATGTRLPGDEDLSGQVLMPAFAEPHAHLDKALTASRAPNPAGDLLGAIKAMQGIAGSLTREDIVTRADKAIRIHLALGTTSVRTHVNVGGPMGMRALTALIEVRERWRGLVDVQVVALVSHPMAGQAGQDLRQRPQGRARTWRAAARTWILTQTARWASAWTPQARPACPWTCTPTRHSTPAS